MLLGRVLEPGKNMVREFDAMESNHVPDQCKDYVEYEDSVTRIIENALKLSLLKDGRRRKTMSTIVLPRAVIIAAPVVMFMAVTWHGIDGTGPIAVVQ